MIAQDKFTGEIPRLSARRLPPENAQLAVNVVVTGEVLEPLYAPELIFNPTSFTGDILSIHIMRASVGAALKFLTFYRDVDVAIGPIAGDTLQRRYFTGEGLTGPAEPKMTTFAAATTSEPYPSSWFVLGVTPPVTAPTVSPSGGTGAADTRSYVYIFQTQYGEQSAPSPVSASTTGKVDDTWALSNMDAAPPNSGTISNAVADTAADGTAADGFVRVTVNTKFGLRAGEEITIASVTGMTSLNATWKIYEVHASSNNISVQLDTAQAYTAGGAWTRRSSHNTTGMTKRIYRTVVATVTTFKFVASIAVATTTYNDTIADSALGEEILSTDYLMPPVDMIAILALPNGMMAGISGNQVVFSEPYLPHVWPAAYRRPLPVTPVGMRNINTTVIVATNGLPYAINGSDPTTLSESEIGRKEWACTAKRGVTKFKGGVAWPCSHGYVLVTGGAADLMTEALYTEREWETLVPSTFLGIEHDGRLFVAYNPGTNQEGILIFDRGATELTKSAYKTTALYTDEATGDMYVAQTSAGGDASIYKWRADISNRLTLDWLSREWVVPKPVMMGAARVDADFAMTPEEVAAAQAAYDAAVAANQALIDTFLAGDGMNGSSLNEYSIDGSGISHPPALTSDALAFTYYSDGELIHTEVITVDQNKRGFKLTKHPRTSIFSYRLTGNVKVNRAELALDHASLGRV